MTQLHRPEGLRLGFGTGALNGRGDRAAQVRLIHAALDAGITHFDTARLYGDGTAEQILGDALNGRRSDVFLVSKAGIIPPINTTFRRAVNKGLTIGRKLPGGVGVLPKPRWNEPTFGQFDVAQLRASLEESLSALGTDYLDLFLLHEVDAHHLADGQVLKALEDWRREGLFCSFGIASTREQTDRILDSYPDAFPVVQTSDSVFDAAPRPAGEETTLLMTHSWLGASLERFQRAFNAEPKFAEKASHCVYADIRRPRRLARCLLEYALHSNPDGQVLFTTSRPDRITQMVRTAERPRLTDAQFKALAKVAEQVAKMDLAPA
ncbi:MAG: aldo/keto reductase [Pseudomonadota bacterium]